MILADQNPLVPNLTESIIGLLAFLIVFGALAKLVMPRAQKILEDRTNAIEGGLERAKQTQEEADATLKEYQAQLADARHEASRLREQAREQGSQIVAEMRQRGQAEYARLVSAATAQIEAERQQALTSLRAEVGALSVELASRIVGESLQDEARQHRTVDRFLAQLEEQSAAQETAR
jgi:F-type H+-transporting ATPase subunit b